MPGRSANQTRSHLDLSWQSPPRTVLSCLCACLRWDTPKAILGSQSDLGIRPHLPYPKRNSTTASRTQGQECTDGYQLCCIARCQPRVFEVADDVAF